VANDCVITDCNLLDQIPYISEYNRVTSRPHHFSQTKGKGGGGALKNVLNADFLDKVVENFCIK
jgi:hypothetical protein